MWPIVRQLCREGDRGGDRGAITPRRLRDRAQQITHPRSPPPKINIRARAAVFPLRIHLSLALLFFFFSSARSTSDAARHRAQHRRCSPPLTDAADAQRRHRTPRHRGKISSSSFLLRTSILHLGLALLFSLFSSCSFPVLHRGDASRAAGDLVVAVVVRRRWASRRSNSLFALHCSHLG